MTEAEVAEYLRGTVKTYVEERVKAGEDPATAAKVADRQLATAFPMGTAASGHLFLHIRTGSEDVGSLWLGPQLDGPRSTWYVFDIVVHETFRRRGFGRAAMLLAEQEVRKHGASELGLNVFGHNPNARTLYESLGYITTATQMRKPV
jgi:ribosomal protein S18 acetylase RimI-like enzyme